MAARVELIAGLQVKSAEYGMFVVQTAALMLWSDGEKATVWEQAQEGGETTCQV